MRLEQDVERRNLLGNMQHGFRKGIQATDALFILSQIIQYCNREGHNLVVAFMDLKKACDTVNRAKLWQIQERLGYGGNTLQVIKAMYLDTKTRDKLGYIVSEEVPVDMGLKQGCVLSPLLFALYISEIAVSLEDSGEGIVLQNERVKYHNPRPVLCG